MDATEMRLRAVVRLALSLLFTVAAGVGWQLDTALITQIAMTALALASVIWAWWKNAPITDSAVITQDYLVMHKNGELPLAPDELIAKAWTDKFIAEAKAEGWQGNA